MMTENPHGLACCAAGMAQGLDQRGNGYIMADKAGSVFPVDHVNVRVDLPQVLDGLLTAAGGEDRQAELRLLDLVFQLRGDRDASYGDVVSVMDELAANGVTRIAIVSGPARIAPTTPAAPNAPIPAAPGAPLPAAPNAQAP